MRIFVQSIEFFLDDLTSKQKSLHQRGLSLRLGRSRPVARLHSWSAEEQPPLEDTLTQAEAEGAFQEEVA